MMNITRIEEIQKQTAYPESHSVQQALIQVWNETERDLKAGLYNNKPTIRQIEKENEAILKEW